MMVVVTPGPIVLTVVGIPNTTDVLVSFDALWVHEISIHHECETQPCQRHSTR